MGHYASELGLGWEPDAWEREGFIHTGGTVFGQICPSCRGVFSFRDLEQALEHKEKCVRLMQMRFLSDQES